MKLVTLMSKALPPTALLAAALFMTAPAASAATIIYCTDGSGTVCELANLAIDSADYDVTFSATPDFTFESAPADPLNAIASALVSLSCQYCFVGDNNATDDAIPFDIEVDYIFVAGPDAQSFEYMYNDPTESVPWGETEVFPCGACGNPFASYDAGEPYIYADFSVVTPEPGTVALMFGGVAILALLERKRRNRQYR